MSCRYITKMTSKSLHHFCHNIWQQIVSYHLTALKTFYTSVTDVELHLHPEESLVGLLKL